jgi:hypothetical protein
MSAGAPDVLFTGCTDSGVIDMRRSDARTQQFEEWMNRYGTELHQGVHARSALTGSVSTENKSNGALPPVVVEQFRTSPHVVNVRSVDPEQIDCEDKLGCVRGVLWSLVFEAAVVIAIVVCWKLRMFLR